MSAKAYVGYNDSSQIKPIINTYLEQVPPYDDKGVKFKNYAKNLLNQDRITANKDYSLTPQTRLINSQYHVHAGGTVGSYGYLVTSIKPSYVTKIVVIANQAAVNFIELEYNSGSTLGYFYSVAGNYCMYQFDFDVPLELRSGVINFISRVGTGFVAGDLFSISVYGWTE